MMRPGPTTRQHNSGQSQWPSESWLEKALFRYQRTMLSSACEGQLPSAKVALVAMYLICIYFLLTVSGLVGKNLPKRGWHSGQQSSMRLLACWRDQ